MEDLKSYVTSLLDNYVYRLAAARQECKLIYNQIESLNEAIYDTHFSSEVGSQLLSALSTKLESKLHEIAMIESIARQLTSIKDQCPDDKKEVDEEDDESDE